MLMKIKECHFTTEESQTRKKKSFPFNHLMTDLGNEFWFSASVLISLVTTNNQFAALFSFQGRNTSYILNKSEKQGKYLYSGEENWIHDAKCEIYIFL